MRWSLESAVRLVITATVGAIGAAAGFTHTHDWAVENGQHGWLAWADAVVIESMAVIAGFEIRRDRAKGRRPTLPVVVLVVAFVVQMAAQVSQARDTFAGWLLAATPALGFLVIVKLSMRGAPAEVSRPAVVSEPTPPTSSVAEPETRLAEEPVLDEVVVEQPPSSLPSDVQPADEELITAQEIEIPMTPGLAWLPVAVRDQVTARVREVYGAGRALEVDDLRDVVALPEPTLASLVREINAAVNVP